MKKLILFIVMMFMVGIVPILQAAEPIIVNAGGGSTTGIYTTVALPKVGEFLNGSGVKLNIIPGGTSINMDRLKSGELDIAMLQFDGPVSEGNQDIDIVAFLYKEYIHFMVRDKKSGGKIDEFSDLNKTHTIAIGDISGGTALTWKVFCSLDKDLKEVQTSPLKGVRALTALAAGEIDAILIVTGLGSKDIMRANADPSNFELVEIDILALDNLKYKGKRVYEFDKITSSTYPGLIEGMTNFSQKCLTVSAVLACSSAWASEHDDLYSKIYDAASAAQPAIKQKVTNK